MTATSGTPFQSRRLAANVPYLAPPANFATTSASNTLSPGPGPASTMTSVLDTAWRHRQAILRAALQGLVCLLALAWVAAEASYHAGRSLRASLALLRASAAIPGVPAASAQEVLRQALLRFLARRYGWRIA